MVTRHACQRGFHVERRFGWDCHGLPVEYEIDKTLNIKGKQDVLDMGIAKYNAECRAIVMRYSEEWRKIVTRLGRWIDFDNDYKTLGRCLPHPPIRPELHAERVVGVQAVVR